MSSPVALFQHAGQDAPFDIEDIVTVLGGFRPKINRSSKADADDKVLVFFVVKIAKSSPI